MSNLAHHKKWHDRTKGDPLSEITILQNIVQLPTLRTSICDKGQGPKRVPYVKTTFNSSSWVSGKGCMTRMHGHLWQPHPMRKNLKCPRPIWAPESLEDLGFDNKSSMPQITLKETSSLTLLRTFVPTSLHELAMRSRDIISCKSVTHAVWKKTPSGKHVSYDSHCACFMPSCLCSEAAWHEDNGGSEHGRSWNVWRQKALCDFCQQSMQRSSATHCTAS